jgi:hypothetical protein
MNIDHFHIRKRCFNDIASMKKNILEKKRRKMRNIDLHLLGKEIEGFRE